MRRTGARTERTGLEAATDYELRLAFYRTANEMVIRMHQVRKPQLSNAYIRV